MGILLIYTLKSAFCLTLFYLLYKWALADETFFRLNRSLLLAFWPLALLLPAIPLLFGKEAIATVALPGNELETVNTLMTTYDPQGKSLEQLYKLWLPMACVVYLAGVIAVSAKTLIAYFRLRHLIRSGRRIEQEAFHLVLVEDELAPFSWMRHIVISEKDYRDNPKEILTHERAHIRHHHSWDLILADVFIAWQWFNPAAWLLKREMRAVHEYEADDAVLRQGVDASGYQLLLIRKAVGERLFAMANNLNQTNLKKRITMMKMKKSNPWNRVKAAIVLPLAAVSVIVFATPAATKMAGEVAQESGKVVSEAGAMIVKADTNSENETSLIEAVFGKKSVSDRARVESNDSVRSLISGFSKPIPDDILVCINGRLTNKEELYKIDIDNIESFTVIEGKNASVIYGDKGKSGALIVTLKKSADESSASSASSENKATAGKVNTITIHQKGNPAAAGDVMDMSLVKLSSKGNKSTNVEVYNMEEEPTYMIDGKTVTKEEIEAISPDDIESVVVNKGGTSGENTVNIFLKKKATDE